MNKKKTIYKKRKKYKNKRTIAVWTHKQYIAFTLLYKKRKIKEKEKIWVKEVWTHKQYQCEHKRIEIKIKERIKMSKIIKNSVNAQIKKHCSCGAKKYSFGSTIVGHILVFGGDKNSNIPIQYH